MQDQTTKAEMPGDAPEAAALYFGEVMHARLKPIGHRFSYRVMSLLIDLDRLAGRGIEDKNGLVLVPLGGFLRRQRHAGEVARGDANVALEGDRGKLFGHDGTLRSAILPGNYTRIKLESILPG